MYLAAVESHMFGIALMDANTLLVNFSNLVTEEYEKVSALPIEEFLKQFMFTINDIPVKNNKILKLQLINNEARNYFIAEYTFPRNNLNPLQELDEFFEINHRNKTNSFKNSIRLSAKKVRKETGEIDYLNYIKQALDDHPLLPTTSNFKVLETSELAEPQLDYAIPNTESTKIFVLIETESNVVPVGRRHYFRNSNVKIASYFKYCNYCHLAGHTKFECPDISKTYQESSSTNTTTTPKPKKPTEWQLPTKTLKSILKPTPTHTTTNQFNVLESTTDEDNDDMVIEPTSTQNTRSVTVQQTKKVRNALHRKQLHLLRRSKTSKNPIPASLSQSASFNVATLPVSSKHTTTNSTTEHSDSTRLISSTIVPSRTQSLTESTTGRLPSLSQAIRSLSTPSMSTDATHASARKEKTTGINEPQEGQTLENQQKQLGLLKDDEGTLGASEDTIDVDVQAIEDNIELDPMEEVRPPSVGGSDSDVDMDSSSISEQQL